MVLLVRHALVDACGRFLAGRQPGIHLNADGRQQVRDLATALAKMPVEAIYSSPLERALETAAALRTPSRRLTITSDLDEIDFGDWTGARFEDLDRRPDWRTFNETRSRAVIPGGESMMDVQERISRCVEQAASRHDGLIVLVSHGDVLRALVALVLGMTIDRMTSFEIEPASVSALTRSGSGFSLTLLNASARGLLANHFREQDACAPR